MLQKSSQRPRLAPVIGFDTLKGDSDAVLAHMETSPLPLVMNHRSPKCSHSYRILILHIISCFL